MSDQAESWCTIESDPGVFTELLEKFGVRGAQVEEVYEIGNLSDYLKAFGGSTCVFGLVFLFRYDQSVYQKRDGFGDEIRVKTEGSGVKRLERKKMTGKDTSVDGQAEKSGKGTQNPENGLKILKNDSEIQTTHGPSHADVFFAEQVVSNACATQALLGTLFNVEPQVALRTHLDLGEKMEALKRDCLDLSSYERGVRYGQDEWLKHVHNSFALDKSRARVALERAPKMKAEYEDESGAQPFHFVTYVCHGDYVYELDGLRKNPLVVGCVSDLGKSARGFRVGELSVDGLGLGGKKTPVASVGNRENENENENVTWLDVAQRAIRRRMVHLNRDDLRYSVMGIVRNQVDVLKDESRRLELAGGSSAEMAEVNRRIVLEKEKRVAWFKDNLRRRTVVKKAFANKLHSSALRMQIVKKR